MKKIFYIIVLFIGFWGNSQTPFPTGIRLPNATKSDTLSTQTRLPIMRANSGNLINGYVPVDSLSGYLDLDKIPETTDSKILTAAERALIGTALQTETDPIFNAWDKDYNDLINKPTFKAVQNEYADMSALYADQGSQTTSSIQFVLDASAHSYITSGSAYFEKLATSTGVEADYRLLSKTEISALHAAQPPFLRELVPDTYLPSTTGNFILRGSFFTPDMIVSVEGHTINYQTFISSNEFIVNLTTSATEGLYDVTLNNGLIAVYPDQLQVVNGTVYTPFYYDWEAISGNLNVEESGAAKIAVLNSFSTGRWIQEFDHEKDFSVQFKVKKSPLGYEPDQSIDSYFLNLTKVSDNSNAFSVAIRKNVSTLLAIRTMSATDDANYTLNNIGDTDNTSEENFDILSEGLFEFRYIEGIMYFYYDRVLRRTFTDVINENLKLSVNIRRFDITEIKYIDLDDGSGELPDMTVEKAEHISVNTTGFTGNLSSADNTVQKALNTIDALTIGGGGTTISADSVYVSPTIRGIDNAYDLLYAYKISIDSIQSNMNTGVNTAFRTVSSTSGVFAESYDSDQPNFQLTLDEDVEIEITDAVNGDFLIAEIVNPEDEPFLVTFIGSDIEYLIEGNETAVFSMVTNANDETIWIKSILEDTASLYKEISSTGAAAIDFKNYDFIKLNVEDENYLEFVNPRKNVANLTLHLENKEGVPYDVHFPENTLFKTLGQGATIELGSDKLGVFKFDYRDGGFICTYYDVEYDIPVTETYTIVRRVNTGVNGSAETSIIATDGFINWTDGFNGGANGPFNNLQVTAGNNLATTSVTWTRHSSIPSSMPDADFQTLFDSERWDASGGAEMKYTFSSMTAGTYKVRIYMGESNGSATVGTRVFDIKIQGSTVESNVDMVAKFGGNQIAGMVEYDNIIVSGTTLDVEWIHVTENPVVNGIEILKRD